MDHLNYFHPYKGKKTGWEDTLTRAMLVLIKYIPAVQQMVVDMIRERQGAFAPEHLLPSYTAEGLSVEVESQTGTIRNDDGILLSVFITDKEQEELTPLREADREKAIYDGILYLGEGITIIVEDKPSAEALWRDQLNPSKRSLEGKEIELVGHPICLTWAGIIDRLNALLERGIFAFSERRLLADFFEFIDASKRFIGLRPYKTLGVCGANAGLLDRRCRDILESLGKVDYHPGWGDYLACRNGSICQMVALRAGSQEHATHIRLELNPGASVPQARALFGQLDRDAIRKLDKGWEVVPNFHFMDSYRQFFWSRTSLDVMAYLDRWRGYKDYTSQFKRNGDNFKELVDNFHAEGLLSDDDMIILERDLINTGRTVLRVIPGLSLFWRWPLGEAISLDANGKFAVVVKRRIQEAFPCWRQGIGSILPREDTPGTE